MAKKKSAAAKPAKKKPAKAPKKKRTTKEQSLKKMREASARARRRREAGESRKDGLLLIKHMGTSQPEDWISAWRDAAKEQGVSLSVFVGNACNEALSEKVRSSLSKRPVPGRPMSA